MTDKKYNSPFKRIVVTPDGGEKIKQLQQEFDIFWKKVNRVAEKSPEKFHAMKSMQEACMWLSRACALSNEKEPNTGEQDARTCAHTDAKNAPKKKNTNKNMAQTGEQVTQTGEQDARTCAHKRAKATNETMQNSPTIVIKRKKI